MCNGNIEVSELCMFNIIFTRKLAYNQKFILQPWSNRPAPSQFGSNVFEPASMLTCVAPVASIVSWYAQVRAQVNLFAG